METRSIYFNVLQNKLSAVLPVNVGAAVVGAGVSPQQIPAFLGAFFSNNNTALAQYAPTILFAAQEAMTDSYVAVFRMIYLVSIAFGVRAFIASLLLADIRKFMVDRVAVDIH